MQVQIDALVVKRPLPGTILTMAQGCKTILLNEYTELIHVDVNTTLVPEFHYQLPSYARTPLTSLNEVAKQLGVMSMFVTDESS